MPAAVIVSVAVSSIASEIGIGVIAADAVGLAADSVAGQVVSGIATGVIGGAASSAVTGGNILDGALFGGISGGVSGGVSSELVGTAADPGVLASSPYLAKGIGSAAGGTVSGLARGESLGQAAEQGIVSGLSTGAANYATQQGWLPTSATGALSSTLNTALTDVLASQPKQTAAAYQPTIASLTPGSKSSSTISPGSAALGQALRVDPGAMLGGGDINQPKRNVWNTASLRVKDETGA